MELKLRKLSKAYAQLLRQYVAQEQELFLERAYALGRKAADRGISIMDIARVHGRTVTDRLSDLSVRHAWAERGRVLKAAELFFTETLSAFEVRHRGLRETGLNLTELNETLTRRNLELETINQKLRNEVRERSPTDAALRESERSFQELFNEARSMQEKLRDLSRHLLRAQEEERTRISRELHDQVGQALTAINMHLTALRNAARPKAKLQKKLSDVQRLVEETMETVHHFARELRPPMLDHLGLLAALRSYVRSFHDRTGVRISFRAWLGVERLTSEQKTGLYRVAQESLTNVAKHAAASEVSVCIRSTHRGVTMEVKDNGKGFAVEQQSKNKKRLGLLGIRERVALLNGQCRIESAPRKGTTVCVQIPFRTTSVDFGKNNRCHDTGHEQRGDGERKRQRVAKTRECL